MFSHLDTNLKLKGRRGFFENEALLNKFSGKKLLIWIGTGYTNYVSSKSWHTNIAIQPYQSYRT